MSASKRHLPKAPPRRLYPGHPWLTHKRMGWLANPIAWSRITCTPASLIRWFRYPPSVEERNIRNVLADSVGVGMAAGVGSFLSVFLVRLGASDFLIGLLTAMPALAGMFLAIPVGQFLSRRRQIVPWFAYARLCVLSCYALTGLVPFFLSSHRAEAILIIWGLATLPQTIVSVSFTVVMGAVAGPRGRFSLMSRRWATLGFTNAVTAFIVGQVLGLIAFPLNYQIVFLSATLGGFVSFYFSSRITLPDQEPPSALPRSESSPSRVRQRLNQVLGNRAFLRFLIGQFVFRWGLVLPVPLIPIYWVRHLHASDQWIGLFNTTQSAVLLVAYLMWNRISRRRGKRFVLLASTLGVSLYPALTALTTRVEPIILLVALFGTFRAGVDLVFFDLALSTCPERERPFYISIYQTTAYTANFLAPLLGAAISSWIGIAPALTLGTLLGIAGFLLLAVLRVNDEEPSPATSA
ncbi:MAG: MFS transporter [Anaerolineae bacterium]|nr:MFS transporter [Anaerolineae bacterium]